MSVGYDADVADSLRLRVDELGGWIEEAFDWTGGLVAKSFLGILPDSAIAVLRGEFQSSIVWIEQKLIGCLTE